MAHLRRILKAFWFGAALSIILSLAIVATSVMDKTCPVSSPPDAEAVAVSVKVPALVRGQMRIFPSAAPIEEPPPT